MTHGKEQMCFLHSLPRNKSRPAENGSGLLLGTLCREPSLKTRRNHHLPCAGALCLALGAARSVFVLWHECFISSDAVVLIGSPLKSIKGSPFSLVATGKRITCHSDSAAIGTNSITCKISEHSIRHQNTLPDSRTLYQIQKKKKTLHHHVCV